MKKLISVLTALLVVIVGNYSLAQNEVVGDDAPVRITKPKPKAQNGANDPEVRAEAEREKIREAKEAQRLTAADLGAYVIDRKDDHVVQFQRGREIFTMISLRDLKLDADRKAAFEAAQVYAEKLILTWLRDAYSLRLQTTDDLVKQEINRLSAEELRARLSAYPNKRPSVNDILASSKDAAEAMKKLKADKKFLVEFEDLINAYDIHQQEVNQAEGIKEQAKKLIPTAALVIGSFKVPDSFLEFLKSTKLFKSVGVLLKGTINYTLVVRPWKVVRHNLDTEAVTEEYHFETIPQGWFVREMVSDKYEVRSPFSIGAGFLFGDFNKARDLNSGLMGASYTFGATNAIANGALPIPAYWDLKAGAMTGTDLKPKNAYLTLTRRFGATPLQKRFVPEAGGVFSLESIAERVKLKSETLEDIIALIEDEQPGTTLTITRGQSVIDASKEKTEELKGPAEKKTPAPIDVPAKP